MFIILAFLTFGELQRKKEQFAFLVAVSYGVIDEVHQYYVPFRSFGFDDISKMLLWVIVRRSYNRRNATFGSFLRKIVCMFQKSSTKVNL
ncbi:VanZ family protein [Alkalihalobacterium alkalinitrilicum]|uniref:VanZ family protein n=1 Tax=Alkalihalobacterium alkalinitrilicum TaxID=427920 RepID=UPI0009953C53|nr:VanZ family protein [Alkalihalobacterium alkalinitrilicum]